MSAPARLLDLTRLVSRQGRAVLTGIDRVELAYLDRLLTLPAPMFGLVQTSVGYLLLDRAGCRLVAEMAHGRLPPPPPDLFSRLARRANPARAGAEALLRRQAVARVLPFRLGRAVARIMPQGGTYLNVGHANLSAGALAALRGVSGLRLAVLLHDVIPLEHPEFARPPVVAAFRHRVQAVAAHADLVIHSCATTRAATEAQLARAGRVPPGVTAPLGVDPPRPGPLPPGLPPARPYVVALGTIEPRKNHALLLDIWERHAPAADLVIAGARGWADPALFARLDAGIAAVHEVNDLDDGAVASLLAGARALLFPSVAEGFGLPAVEALMLGCPVICSDLPVFREILDDKAVYVDPSDSYSWAETMAGYLADNGPAPTPARGTGAWTGPTGWDDHFNRVLTLA